MVWSILILLPVLLWKASSCGLNTVLLHVSLNRVSRGWCSSTFYTALSSRIIVSVEKGLSQQLNCVCYQKRRGCAPSDGEQHPTGTAGSLCGFRSIQWSSEGALCGNVTMLSAKVCMSLLWRHLMQASNDICKHLIFYLFYCCSY